MTSPVTAVAAEFMRLVRPLARALSDPFELRIFLRDMGFYMDLADAGDAVLAALPGSADIVGGLTDALSTLETIDSDPDTDVDVGPLVAGAVRVRQGIAELATFDPASDPAITSLAGTLGTPAFWVDVVADVPGQLVVRYLRERTPFVHRIFRLLALIEDRTRDLPFFDDAPPEGATYESLRWERIIDVFSGTLDPAATDPSHIITELLGLFELFGVDGRLEPITPGVAASVFDIANAERENARQLALPVLHAISGGAEVKLEALVAEAPSMGPTGPVDGLFLTFASLGAASLDVTAGDFTFAVGATGSSAGAAGIVVGPGGVSPVADLGSTELGLTASVVGEPDGGWSLPKAGSLRFQLERIAFDAGLDLVSGDLQVALGVTGVGFTVGGGDSDAFVGSLVGSVTALADIDMTWSSAHGFSITGQAGIGVVIPINAQIGPVLLREIELAVAVGADITAALTVTASAELGPLQVSVDRIGIEVVAVPNSEPGGGTLGPFDLAPAFKPPAGLGLGIDMGPITGGGYLDIDRHAGTYKGLVSAEVLSIGITAVVIVETKRPDVDGWSMFFALFIELPQIQLGFGFSLNGVGGLAGINRTLDPEALGSAVRSGSLGSILFPEDPIVDAPMIISELEAIFPAADNSYVFGPVVKIGWGTPPIVEAEMGIVIAFGPDGVIVSVLGSITAILPRPEVQLMAIRLDFAGTIDTGQGTISFDASLHDSHIIGFAIAGDMALRASFSDSRSFLFSVGGFHPSITPPAGFPELERVSLGISAGSIIEISFTCYFAITSNTVQFGASFELWVKIIGFEISGGTSFDALIRFSPFELETSISLWVSIKAGGVQVASARLDASLTGPSPWHVVGTAEFKVLGIGKEARVNKTIGTRTPQPPAPAAPNLLAKLAEELALPQNWSVVSAETAGVVFADRHAAPSSDVAPLFARPDSTIQVSQTVVPLGVELDKFENTSIADQNRFGVSTVGGLGPVGAAVDWFAPAQFFDVKPKERLAQPSFEQFDAGLSFGSDTVEAGDDVVLRGGHDEYRVDPEFDPVSLTSPRVTESPNHRLIHSAELGAERTNTFRVTEPVRFELIQSPAYTRRTEAAR